MNYGNPSSGGERPFPRPAFSSPQPHASEPERLASVRELSPLTQKDDRAMVALARDAARCCEVSVGMVSLLEDAEEWVVACVGTEVERVPRALSFCAHAILEPDVLVVEDASRDERFRSNPFVLDEHHLRFYAGAPILDAGGLPIGAVCVADAEPRALSSKCLLSLRDLAQSAIAVLEIRLLLREAGARHAPEGERQASRRRLDDFLLDLVAPGSARP